MIVLENEKLKVTLANKGAEIIRIDGKLDGLNRMWRRDPVQWANSAPILFPIVGSLINNQAKINGEVYTMSQHGFSRHNEYTAENVTDTSVTFRLQTNEDIKTNWYPFLFDLAVTYTIEDDTLKCHIEVSNIDNQEIYFQVGGHPAFACPLMEGESSNDYYIEFEQNETARIKIIDDAKGKMTHITEPFFDNERRFFVRQVLFDRNAIVFKNFKSEWVAIKSLNHNKVLKFHMDNFDHLGIWAAKHVGGLIALEPWVGHTDYEDFNGEFKEKESIVTLQPGEKFECTFAVEVTQD